MKPEMKKFLSICALIFAVLLLCAGTWLNYLHLTEAFGDGPPYYGRTTNMDKWENPVLFLIAIDIGILVLIGLILKIALPALRNR